MLKTLSHSEVSKQEFVVLDIENRPDGSVLRVTTAWRENGVAVYRSDYGWAGWWSWFHPRAVEDQKFRTAWAHNGGAWDWLSLLNWLMREGHANHSGISIVAPSSKIIVAKVETPAVKITLSDSCELLRSSLQSLAMKFCGRGKIDLAGKLPHEIADTDPVLLDQYCREDCLLLLEILEGSLEFIRRKIAKIDKLSNTIGGTALRVWRTMGLRHPILSPWRPELREMLRVGFHGGRCESFVRSKWFGSGINVYDINSCYAEVMRTTRVPATGRTMEFRERELRPNEVGVYYVIFEQQNTDIPPLLLQQQGQDRGHGTYRSEGVYYSPEIHALREFDPTAKIRITGGYSFVDCGRIFKDFATNVYRVRCEDRDGPGGVICKSLLCSLWGKFSQKGEMERLCAVNSVSQLIDMVRDGAKIRPITPQGYCAEVDFAVPNPRLYPRCPVYAVAEKTEVHHEHVGISGVIASAARVALFRGMAACGSDNIVYVDTDSVHVLGALPRSMVSQHKLGGWKLLQENCDGAYVSSQMYALKWGGGEKVVAKGVALDSRNLTYEKIRAFAEFGKDFEVEYRGANTIHDVLGGADPCVFRQKRKTIRRQRNVAII